VTARASDRPASTRGSPPSSREPGDDRDPRDRDGPEEAYDNAAEFWCANELMGVTVLHEGRLHLRIDPRTDGMPWLADTASPARAGRGLRPAGGLLSK